MSLEKDKEFVRF